MITMIDNYDSFTWNLVQQIERLSGERLEVVRNDAFDVDALLESRPDAIVISPGPGRPETSGRIVELIRRNTSIPLFGVCLGHQAIGEAFGATVSRGEEPVHGKITEITHGGRRLFAGCDATMRTARYHSLVVDRESLPGELLVDAETRDGVVMAISHVTRPVFGVQFHPESYGTVGGDRVVENFLAIAAEYRARAARGPADEPSALLDPGELDSERRRPACRTAGGSPAGECRNEAKEPQS